MPTTDHDTTPAGHVGSTDELERGGETGLTFEYPKHLEHPIGRANLTAAYLLEYWAKKGAIQRYDGVIDGLREGATEIFKVAKPVRSNAKLTDLAPGPHWYAKPGRPEEMQGGKRRNVYLDEVSWAKAVELGNGNASDGIRMALARAG